MELSESSDDDLPDVCFGGSTTAEKNVSSLRPPSKKSRTISTKPPSSLSSTSSTYGKFQHEYDTDHHHIVIDTSPISSSGRSKHSTRTYSREAHIMDESILPCKAVTESKTSVKQERMEKKRKEALEKQKASEARKREREQMKAEKQQQNKMNKALKRATSESSKENSPNERLKQMVVILDTSLSENAELMAELASEMKEAGVEYRVSSELYPGSVRWKRKVTERNVNDDAEVIKTVIEEDENELLVTLEAQGFFGLVHHTKQAKIGNPLPVGSSTLQQFVENILQDNLGIRVNFALEGVDAFIRGNKTRFNRQYRQAVLSSGESSSSSTGRGMFTDITRVDCEEALVDLQMFTGCMTRVCANGAQLAEHIITLTKALSEAHYKKETPFSFHLDPGQGASKKALSEADSKESLIWKHQLMQFNNLSELMAASIVADYPSPAHLLSAYKCCSDQKEAEQLLQDIMVRRGVGVVSSTRRLGPVLSKRIHFMMTSRDKDAHIV